MQEMKSHFEKHCDRDIPVAPSGSFHFWIAWVLESVFSHSSTFYFHSFCLLVLVLPSGTVSHVGSQPSLDWFTTHCGCSGMYRAACPPNTITPPFFLTDYFRTHCLPWSFSRGLPHPHLSVALTGQRLLFLPVIVSWMGGCTLVWTVFSKAKSCSKDHPKKWLERSGRGRREGKLGVNEG